LATRATTDARRDETLGEALGLYRAFLERRFGSTSPVVNARV
jgi:hypothetical protein